MTSFTQDSCVQMRHGNSGSEVQAPMELVQTWGRD